MWLSCRGERFAGEARTEARVLELELRALEAKLLVGSTPALEEEQRAVQARHVRAVEEQRRLEAPGKKSFGYCWPAVNSRNICFDVFHKPCLLVAVFHW